MAGVDSAQLQGLEDEGMPRQRPGKTDSRKTRAGHHGGQCVEDGVTLEFKDICFEVVVKGGGLSKCFKNRRTTKKILWNVSGKVEPGDVVALMGASGAGKSTLLNTLSRRTTKNSGTVLLNGQDADKDDTMQKVSCFIQQEDIFFGFMTVEEHLHQQAALRIPLVKTDRDKRVASIMETFSLAKSRNARIGNIYQNARRGISGGEKKRLSVGTELLTNPKLIFADEPTSGLDAFMAESVVELLTGLARRGHTVITTIHQPSSDVFALFNKLLLISEGRVLYYGPRLGAIPYFLRLGHPCPPYTNPADFFIELCAIDWEDPKDKLSELVRWAEQWESNGTQFLNEWKHELEAKFETSLGQSDYNILGAQGPMSLKPEAVKDGSTAKGAGSSSLRGSESEDEPFSLPTDAHGRVKPVPVGRIFSTLLSRSWISTSRNPTVVRARLGQTIITAFMAGFVFMRLTDAQWYSKCGACFFILVNQAFASTYIALMAFMPEKAVVIRERDTGLYSLQTYFFSKLLSDFCFQFYLPILYSIIAWWLIGLNDTFTRYLLGLVSIFLITQAVGSIGYFVAAIAPTMGVGVALCPVILLPSLIVSGFIVRKNTLTRFWSWIYHISPFTYGFSALMRATFLNVEFQNMPPVTSGIQKHSGNEVLNDFSIDLTVGRWGYDIMALILWAIGGRCLACLLFVLCNRKKAK